MDAETGGAATIRVYSRPGCHLCEELIEQLEPLVRGRLAVEVVDVDTREEWREAYGARVPVLEFDGRAICEYRLDREALHRLLES